MERIKIDEFHYHEIVHTAYLSMDFFAEHVAQHVAVLANKELSGEANDIVKQMYKFYCMCSKYADSHDSAKEFIDE